MSPRAVMLAAFVAVAGRAGALELYVPELPQPTAPPARSGDDGDTSFTDLRLTTTIGIAGTYTAQVSMGGGDPREQTGDWRGAFALHVDRLHSSGLKPWGGLIWSIGGDLARSQADIVDKDATLWVLTGTFAFGYGLPFGRNVQLELAPYASVGVGVMDDHIDDGSSRVSGAWVLAAGGRGVFAVTLDNGLQFAATGGWGVSWVSIDREGHYQATITSQGFFAGALVGKRF